jgi:RNA polymerase sigma-70 factor, ECF subfamily
MSRPALPLTGTQWPPLLTGLRISSILKLGSPYLRACSCVIIIERPLWAWEKRLTEERDLLHRARLLDEAALGAIFDTYYPAMYRYIYHHLGHQATAEDLAAEVFARTLEQLANGRGPQHHLLAWLYRVAHNLVVDECRRRSHRDHDPLDETMVALSDDVGRLAEAAILHEKARSALADLTPQQRAVIILKFLEGYENREIAQILDTPLGAVKALQHRGLAAMRRSMDRPKVRKQVEP